MTITIRQLQAEDFPAWKSMRQELYTGLDPAFHEQEMKWIFKSNDVSCFIVESEENEVIGFFELSLRNIVDGCVGSPVGYVEGIYLKRPFRSKGYGSKIMEFVADWFRHQGCHEMAADAEADRLEAHEFYRSVGFEEMWRIVQFKRSL